jgi:nitrate reductase molybdenum cofactor assembly chaperone NarJ/NarW
MEALKIISMLLSYPEEELITHQQELCDAVSELTLSFENKARLMQVVDQLISHDLLDSQEFYINTFDRGRSCSLLMFEHVHGQSRDRGQAMIDLLNLYESKGLELNARELPDYLPLFLEFLSVCDDLEAIHWLKDMAPILELIEERLRARESIYSPLFTVLVELSDHTRNTQLAKTVSQEKPDDTPEAIDEVWEEEAVRFMDAQQQQSCTTYKPAPNQQVADVVRVPLN